MSAPSQTTSAVATTAVQPAIPSNLLSLLTQALEAVVAANQQAPVVNQAATQANQAQQLHVQAYNEWNRRQQIVQQHRTGIVSQLQTLLTTAAPAAPAAVTPAATVATTTTPVATAAPASS